MTYIFDKLDTTDFVLLSVLLFFLIVQLIYYWAFFAKPFYYKKKIAKGKITFSDKQPSVSVIVYAKNETENLQNFLLSILNQNYPQYEVIVVNDSEIEESDMLLKQLEHKHKQLYHTYIPQGTKNINRKKLGMTLGIKAANYDVLLFTEADTYPVGSEWISGMSRHFYANEAIVLGFNAFEKQRKFIWSFLAYDYFFDNMQTIVMGLSHRIYGANGRNLAYHRDSFYNRKGYAKRYFPEEGEDDLFVNEIADSKNVVVELSPSSVTFTKPTTLFDWKEMKLKQIYNKRFYKKGPVIFWKMELLSRILFFISIIVCFMYDFWNIVLPACAVLAILIRLFSQIFVINKVTGNLKLQKYYFTLPFFDIFQLLLNIYFYIYRLFRRKKKAHQNMFA